MSARRFPDKATARATSRRVRLARRVELAPSYCEDCRAWHVVSVDKRIKDTDRVVLQGRGRPARP
jgi:hypothetical protein